MEMKFLRCATIALALVIFVQTSKSASADLIEKTCKKTSNFTVCVSFFRSKPGSTTADVKGLAQIMVEQLQIDVKDTLAKVTKLYEETTERILKGCFSVCSDLYHLAIHNTEIVVSDLKENNFSDARDTLGFLYGDANDCEATFHEDPPGVRPSPLTKDNDDVKNLSQIASEIVFILG